MANCSTGARTAGSVTASSFSEPTLEPGQRFVAGGQGAGVFEQTPQMAVCVRAGFVKALMGQRDIAAGQSRQQGLDSAR